MMGAVVHDAEELLAQSRHEAAQAKTAVARALADLQLAQNDLLTSKLDGAIAAQRRVEEEAILFTKEVNTLYHRATKWNAEQKRFRLALEGLDGFELWATGMESELRGVAGNLEYVCAVLERESTDRASANGASH